MVSKDAGGFKSFFIFYFSAQVWNVAGGKKSEGREANALFAGHYGKKK